MQKFLSNFAVMVTGFEVDFCWKIGMQDRFIATRSTGPTWRSARDMSHTGSRLV